MQKPSAGGFFLFEATSHSASMAAHPSPGTANGLSGNVPPSSCSYFATLRTGSALILPCIVSALPLGPIREYGHAAAVTTHTSAATIPLHPTHINDDGLRRPLLIVDDHTDLSMPDSRLSTTHCPYDNGITVTWRLTEACRASSPRFAVIITSGYFFWRGYLRQKWSTA
jgi:hypothetical protein